MTTKLAVPTDDGETISRHFGQAKYFRVLTLENIQAAHSELREKASHQHGDHSHRVGIHPGLQMIEAISDCQVLVCGGMGTPAYNRAVGAGLTVILTRQSSIDAAVQAYLAGTLENEPQLVHAH
jgi:predicted Fe-Mo cluster-binding NifX family protein